MKVVTDARELPTACAFVPTMGALHAGHASLFTLAKKYSDEVVASIFVNPLQFENKEDLAKYPRTPELDIEIAAASGVTYLWMPKQAEIYPENFVKLSAGSLGEIYEGKSRPGHFDGVVTVVRRLFDLVKPKVAIFGEKDFQQLFLIKEMVTNYKLPIDIVAHPIVRESDGLALSSRNVRLTPEDRKRALVIYRALTAGRDQLRSVLDSEPAWRTDYATVINPENFKEESSAKQHAIVAGWIGGVRLIDNMEIMER